MADFRDGIKNTARTVAEETREVFEEGKAAVHGERIHSDVVGAAGYRDNQSQNNALAIITLVIGILSIIVLFINMGIGIVMGIIGIVLGSMARKKQQSSLATAGFVCSIVAVILGAVFVGCLAGCLVSFL